MRILLILAHGSRRGAANEEVRQLAAELAKRLQGRFEQVEAAFLELADPAIADAVDSAVAAGATDITLFPYFLAAGRHIAEDIPSIVDACRRRHTNARIALWPHLGALPGLMDFLAAELGATRPPPA